MKRTNFFIILALSISMSLPITAYAATIDIFTGPLMNLAGCPCPTSWNSIVTNNPTVSSGREYLHSSIGWVEGYDDIDLRIRAPNDVTNYYGTAGIPATGETIQVSSPASGGWDMWYRTFSIGTSDESGATAGTPKTSAFEFP